MSGVDTGRQYLDTDKLAAMDTALGDLEVLWARCLAVAATSIDVSGGSAKGALEGFNKEMRESLDRLREWKRRVESGEWTFEKWAGFAIDFRNAMGSVIGDAGNWQLSGYLVDVGRATATEVSAKVDSGVTYGLPFVAAIVIGLLLLKVLR